MATPFFIGSISEGRTIRQTILGGYFWGLSGTFTSFIILGNYGLNLQVTNTLDLISMYQSSKDLYQMIISVMKTLPWSQAGLVLLAVTMIAFYSTSFDALTMVASTYSYKALPSGAEPHRNVKLFWAVLLIRFLFESFPISSINRIAVTNFCNLSTNIICLCLKVRGSQPDTLCNFLHVSFL